MNVNLKTKFKKVKCFIFIVLFLTSCGGGGSSTPPPVTELGSSDWDTMQWDQDNWG